MLAEPCRVTVSFSDRPRAERRRRRCRLVYLVPSCVALALLAAGCSFQQFGAFAAAQLLDDGFAAINSEVDLVLAQEGAGASLKLLDGLLLADPGNARLLLAAAEGYVGYTTAFVPPAQPARATLLYRRARDYALRAWQRHARATIELADPRLWLDADRIALLLSGLGADSVPYAYWTAASWAGLINANRADPALLADLPAVVLLAQFVVDRDPAFAYGGAHLLLGVLASSLPRFASGSSDAIRAHFEAALEASQRRFLMTQVLFAETFAVQQQDRRLFDQLIAEVLAAELALPEQGLANSVARARAADLAGRSQRLFVP